MSIVCVTGMHRSGTSLVSRVINLLGVDLGDEQTLIPPSENNPRGFWENIEITDINDRVLETLGGSWEDVPPLEVGWEHSTELDPLRSHAAAVLREHLPLDRLSGWKDPRTSLTLPFWNTVADVRATILCLRPPHEVAASLARRDGFDPEKSAHLWLRYVAGAWLNDPHRLVVRYDEFHTDLDAATKRVAGHLGLPPPDEDTLGAIREFVDPSLHHHPDAEAPPGPHMQLALEVWELLTEREPASVTSLLDALNATWTARAKAEFAERRRQEALEAELAAQRAHTERVERRLERIERRYEALRSRPTVRLVLKVTDPLAPLRRMAGRARGALGIVAGTLRRARNRIWRTPMQAAIHAAETAMARGDWQEAAGRWREVLDTYGGRAPVRAYVRLSITYRRLGDPEGASAVIEDARANRRRDVAVDTEHAEVAMAQGDLEEAVRRWHAVLDTYGTRAPTGAYARLSTAYRRLGDPDAAEAAIEDAHAARRRHVSIAAEYAEVAMAREQWEEAIRRWRAVLDTYGEQASARADVGLSVAYRNAGELDAADTASERALARREAEYDDWIRRNDTLGDTDRDAIRSRIATFERRPRFSVLADARHTPAEHLERTLHSVREQLYADWELFVVGDAAADGLREPFDADPRVKVGSDGIPAASETADGDWLVLLDGGDTLAEHALYLLAEAINAQPAATVLYSDHDHLDDAGRRCTPCFKPDWDPDRMLGQNLVSRLVAFPAAWVRQVGGFRTGCEGNEDWDLALRVVEAAPDAPVVHLPFVLCHRRGVPDAHSAESGRRVVAEHLERTRRPARVSVSRAGSGAYNRVHWPLLPTPPLVSVVVPTKNRRDLLATCVGGLLERTSYAPLEVVVVDNDSTDPAALAYLDELRERDDVSVVRCPGAFNFSRLCNRGVGASRGEIVVLLNNDIEVIDADWLHELAAHAMRPEVGAVGAKLCYPNDSIQHAGIVLGVGRLAGHELRFFPRSADGPFGRARVARGVSAVTAACLATRREVYRTAGGLDETNLPIAYNDVDLCLRLREAGYRVIWTPFAELYHHERASRGLDTARDEIARSAAEVGYMRERWGPRLEADPFYNPNLTLRTEDFALADPIRVHKPWLTADPAGAVRPVSGAATPRG